MPHPGCIIAYESQKKPNEIPKKYRIILMNKSPLYPNYISTVPPLEQCSVPPPLVDQKGEKITIPGKSHSQRSQYGRRFCGSLGHTAHLFLTSDNDI
jgi:hypothetical protein